jgi:hypothetical protein
LSSVITEKVRVKELIVRAGTFLEAPPDVLGPVDDELLPHAARTRLALAASDIAKLFLLTSFK